MELRKMHKVVITQSARGDLHNIYNYVLNEWGESVAEKVYAQISNDIEWLQSFPEMAIIVDTEPGRQFGFRRKISRKYSIIYTAGDSVVTVWRIYNNATDLERKFADLDELFGK